MAAVLNLTDEDISYKTVERLYSDPDVFVLLYNLLSKTVKGFKVDAAMDGTGYSLVVSRHYRTERETAGEGVKEGEDFGYSFLIIDLDRNLSGAFGYSPQSAREDYEMALKAL